jgi:hypothetical protein
MKIQAGFHLNCHVVIEEVDVGGTFVRIKNRGTGSTSIGGWIIHNEASTMEVKFKFNSRMELGAGETITVSCEYFFLTQVPYVNSFL